MSNLQNLRHRPFLVVNTIQRPARGVNTSQKDWHIRPSNWAIFENPVVVDRVSNKHLCEATVIIDILDGRIIKNRFDEVTDNEVVEHYLGKYMEECKQAVDIWMSQTAQRLKTDPDFAAYAAKGAEKLAARRATADKVGEDAVEATE